MAGTPGTATPTHHLPIDPAEQPILDALQNIQTQLLLLKQDRSSYIKSSDVVPLYDRTIEQIQLLNEARQDNLHENRVDRVVEGCLQLLSLFFMTIGRNNEAPAAYALTSTIKRLVDHLHEAQLYSGADLTHIHHTLDNLSENVKNAHEKHSEKLITLLAHRLDTCTEQCYALQQQLHRLDPALVDIHEKIISIIRQISLANTKPKFNSKDVNKFKEQLLEIKSKQADGHFVSVSGIKPAGDDEVGHLLDRALWWVDTVLERKGVFPEAFQKVFNELCDVRNTLEKLSLTQAWSLREADLFDYQRKLDTIDESRHDDGNFYDAEGKPAELYVQRTLLYLIRRSYGYIYYLMVSSEPVSEALLPVYNQLQTLRKCLLDVKQMGGISSPRELYPYSMKLHSIDNMKKDGKFMVGDEIPEGQASVIDLLNECFELNYELRSSIDEKTEIAGE